MNMKRFTAKTSRDALALVREAFGDDAVVMSTRHVADGVEVLAMAPESLQHLERVTASAEPARAQPQRPPLVPVAAVSPARRSAVALPAQPGVRTEPSLDGREFKPSEPNHIERDVEQLQMSTLSFQDYVRERMLKRRRAELDVAEPAPAPAPAAARQAPAPNVAPIEAARARLSATRPEPPVLRDEVRLADLPLPRAAPALAALGNIAPPAQAIHVPAAAAAKPAEQLEVMTELRSMRGMIEQRFGALAFMEKLQRQPRQAQLAQRLLDAGFSPALVRKLAESLPADVDELAWAGDVLQRNLATAERDNPLEDSGGVFALVGSTGVGKTTSTAKLAAAFATRHGASQLGLITLDAYRIAAHEQLRTYGRILGVPVHTAHDRASLEDLLDLLSAKKMVLIDTAGMAQRDSRTRELLDMLSHRSIHRLLVVNSAAQGETIEDQLAAYVAPSCRGVILSKLDEAVKLGPALDSMIRHRLKVLAVANGQRVPEDWHRLSANALVQRALKNSAGPAWRLDGGDVNLIFAGLPLARAGADLHGLASLGSRATSGGLTA